MRVKLLLACQEVLKRVWPSINRNRLLFIRIQTVPPRMHTAHGNKLLISNTEQLMKSHRGPNENVSTLVNLVNSMSFFFVHAEDGFSHECDLG